MGELKIGDLVFDEAGAAATITYATDIMYGHKCYEVVFSDGAVIVADAEHLWETHEHRYRKSLGRRVDSFSPRYTARPHRERATTRLMTTLMTTTQIKETLFYGKRSGHNHAIPVAGPLQCPAVELPTNPYVLGVWLGDGDSGAAHIACNDEEIIEYIRQAGYPVKKMPAKFMWAISDGVKERGENGAFLSRPESLHTQLKSQGLFQNKHVPEVYLRAEVWQRIELLKGLMDTDGTVSKRGACCFDNTNKHLADAVFELVVGLGMKATRSTKQSKLNGKDCAVCYRVAFIPHIPVFKLSRKLNRQKLSGVKKTQYYRYITDVREYPSVPVRCIQVDSPSHLYLAGRQCIPTHNTQVGIYRILRSATEEKAGLYWWVGLSWRSASLKRAWRLLKYYTRKVWLSLDKDPANYIRETDKEIYLPNSSAIWMRTAERPDSLTGEALRGAVIDEFSLMNESVWNEYIEAALLDYEGWALFLGVPKGNNWAAKLWRQAGERAGWRAFHFTTYDNPHMPAHRIEEIKRNTPELLFNQEYLAKVIDDAGMVFRRVTEAAKAPTGAKPVEGHVYVVGADWGREHDYTAIAVIDATTQQMVALERFNRISWNLQRRRLAAICRLWKPVVVWAEENSIGSPNIEALQVEGLPVRGFITTAQSKAPLIEGLALAIERDDLEILPEQTLINELQSYTMERLPSGAFRYGAPSGMFDDTVIATALSWYGVAHQPAKPFTFNW